MTFVKNAMRIAGVVAAMSVATPSFAAYTLFTGDAGGFVVDSSTLPYRAAQGTPTEFISFSLLANGMTATGNPINGSLFSNRVTFSSLNSPLVSFSGAGPRSEIGPNDSGGFNGTLIITLAQAARAVGFGTVERPIEVTFFDPLGNVIQTHSPSEFFGFTGLVGDAGSTIQSVRLTGRFFAIQDFQFATADQMPVVPEPATWAMLIVGFGAVGFSLRSAKRRSGQKLSTKIRPNDRIALA